MKKKYKRLMLQSKVFANDIESMFPGDSKKLREEVKIHYTMRIMPEDQNSGGFYVALLKKNAHVTFKNKTAGANADTAETKEEADEDTKSLQKTKLNDGSSLPTNPAPEETANQQPQTIRIEKKKRGGYAVPKMDYIPFAEKYNDAWVAIRDMYGFDDVA